MPRDLSPEWEAELAGRTHRRVYMLRLDLEDGSILTFTANDQDVPFDLGDGAGELVYKAKVLGSISDVELTLGLDPSNFEFTIPFGDDVTLAAVAGGRFNDADVYLFQANPRRTEHGPIELLFGQVTDSRPEGGEAFFEVQGEEAKFAQEVGETITTQCIRTFGDALCGVTPETITGTVIDILDDETVRFAFAGTYADDYFNFGKVNWTTGVNVNTRPIEIYDWTSTGWISFYYPLADLPAIGDEVEISRGCSKSRHHSDPTVPTCATYSNARRFDGYPDISGTDQLLRPTIPGQGVIRD